MANEFIARNGLISQNNSVVTGSLTVTQGITGSLQGTATTASFAPDYVLNSVTSSMLEPYVLNSNTGSFITNSQTSSMSVATASFVQNAQSASYVLQAVSSSYAETASFALNAGGGGTNLGLVVAISLGYQNLF